MFSHGVMTALFFAMVGAIYDQAHTREIGSSAAWRARCPGSSASSSSPAWPRSACPAWPGFVAEFMIFLGAFKTYPLAGVLCVIAVAVTATYILRLMARVVLRPVRRALDRAARHAAQRVDQRGILVRRCCSMGLYPAPFTA